MSKSDNQDTPNHEAIVCPKAGDYWSEHFCPYLLVVQFNKMTDDVTVLSCLPDLLPCAKVSVDNDYWEFDVSKAAIIKRTVLLDIVTYSKTNRNFVADVVNSPKTRAIAEEWRLYEVERLQEKINELTGWNALSAAPSNN